LIDEACFEPDDQSVGEPQTSSDLARTELTAETARLHALSHAALTAHPSRAWSRVPSKLGDYEIIEEIGSGGMGVVFKARDIALGRIVALKLLRHTSPVSDGDMDRFFREARFTTRLSHPSIANIYHIGQSDGILYVVSEFIEGVNVRVLVTRDARRRPSARDAANLISEVANALQHLHNNGIVHRDIKPSNIICKPDCHAVVVDFGLARSLADDEASLTSEGAIMGTPAYMSPEQAEGRRGAIGPASDIYSLGATLYALTTGRPPFQGATAVETLRQICEAEPDTPRRSDPTVPRDLEAICLRCLQKDPRRRYPTAQALADDLQRFLAGEPVAASPPRALERLARWGRRRPAWFAVALSVLLGLSLVTYQRFEMHREASRRLEAEGLRDLRGAINRTTEAELRRSLIVGEAGIRDHSDGREGLRTLASTYRQLGDVLVNTGRLADAAKAYERAATLLQRHLRKETGDVASRVELGNVFANLGEVSWALGRGRAARAAYSEALIVRRRLVAEHPEFAPDHDELARTLDRLNQLSRLDDLGVEIHK
jgi:hypothetical protein